MRKCDYCAKEISNFEQYCCEECEQKTVRYHQNMERWAKLFTIVNTICVFGIPAGLFMAAFYAPVGVGVATLSCMVLGIMLILLPFPTEGMIKKHKLEKAIKMSRVFGFAVIALGILIAGLNFVLNR